LFSFHQIQLVPLRLAAAAAAAVAAREASASANYRQEVEAGRRREAALSKDLAAERERYERHTLDLELEKAGGYHLLTIVRSLYKSSTQLFYL
jgi:hypothetical protein